MMGIETMKNVSPKTVDRSTLVQRSSIRLDPAAPREDRLRAVSYTHLDVYKRQEQYCPFGHD